MLELLFCAEDGHDSAYFYRLRLTNTLERNEVLSFSSDVELCAREKNAHKGTFRYVRVLPNLAVTELSRRV